MTEAENRLKESTLEQKHRRIAMTAGWFVAKVMRTARNGFPDRFYARAHPKDVCRTCNRGRVILLEWKRPGGVVSPQQELRIGQLKAAGVEVYVVSSIEEANRILGITTETSRICLCGCGRRFNGSYSDFAFDACRVRYENIL